MRVHKAFNKTVKQELPGKTLSELHDGSQLYLSMMSVCPEISGLQEEHNNIAEMEFITMNENFSLSFCAIYTLTFKIHSTLRVSELSKFLHNAKFIEEYCLP